MAGSPKKAVVRQFNGALTWGYLPPSGFVHSGTLELLDTAGRVLTLPLSTIKTVAFVRDFNLDDPNDPERIGRRSYPARPRGEGLWLRLEFRDRDTLEGLAHFDLPAVDALTEDGGLSIIPPEPRSNTQRLFIPRSALVSLQVLGWITSPSRQKPTKPAQPDTQGGLFDL